MAFYDMLTEFVFVENVPEPSEMIFIPGSGYGELAQKAAELYHHDLAKKIVVSGRYGITQGKFTGPNSPKEYVGRKFDTECEFLKTVLLECEVPENAILLENQATYTYQNAIFTRNLLEKEGLIPQTVILVCQAFHARRSLLYYQQQFPHTRFLVCPAVTREIDRKSWFLDENKIDIVLGEIERCGNQFHKIMKERLQ